MTLPYLGVKEARDSRFQALLPIRGKIVNTSKENIKKVLANQEVQDIAKCLMLVLVMILI